MKNTQPIWTRLRPEVGLDVARGLRDDHAVGVADEGEGDREDDHPVPRGGGLELGGRWRGEVCGQSGPSLETNLLSPREARSSSRRPRWTRRRDCSPASKSTVDRHSSSFDGASPRGVVSSPTVPRMRSSSRWRAPRLTSPSPCVPRRPGPTARGSARTLRSLVSLAAFLAAALPAHALDPGKAVEEYVLDQWDVRHGLPFTTVRAIRQTPDGYLWLGTQSGLVRFDGAALQRVGPAERTRARAQPRVEPRGDPGRRALDRHERGRSAAGRAAASSQRARPTASGRAPSSSAATRACGSGRPTAGVDRWQPAPVETYSTWPAA